MGPASRLFMDDRQDGCPTVNERIQLDTTLHTLGFSALTGSKPAARHDG